MGDRRCEARKKMTDKRSSRELRKVLCRLGYLTEILDGISPSALNHADVCTKSFIKETTRNNMS